VPLRFSAETTFLETVRHEVPRRVSHHILVAEDEPDIRDLLRLALEGAGHTVTIVADGQAAWEQAQADRPRLVVTDLRMPAMDGLALIQALRGHERLRAVPVVLFTAYVTTDPRVSEARKLPGVEVVTKGPIADLRAAVARALGSAASGAA
jgi:CheY-like chemotaxis protein